MDGLRGVLVSIRQAPLPGWEGSRLPVISYRRQYSDPFHDSPGVQIDFPQKGGSTTVVHVLIRDSQSPHPDPKALRHLPDLTGQEGAEAVHDGPLFHSEDLIVG